MSFETFAANIDDPWFPAMDDVVCVPHSDGDRMVLVLDHEEVITFSSVNPCGDAGGSGQPADQRRADSLAASPGAHVSEPNHVEE